MSIFTNPRLAALPCELMRSCTFAEDFITMTRMSLNLVDDVGSGITANHGATNDGVAYLASDPLFHGTRFSVTIRFSADALVSNYTTRLILSATDALTTGNADGFAIGINPDGIIANHSDGAGSLLTPCEVDLDYSDGETHTVTYVVDLVAGTHILYVDALTADTQTTDKAGITGGVDDLRMFHGDVSHFVGTISKVRIFDVALTAEEHALYHSGSIVDFMSQPLAVYRCDEICDDTAGHKIWDRTLNQNDLYKADRVASAKFPTLSVDKYTFDGIDDYVTNWPTLPTTHTLVAALSSVAVPYPAITQENDSTLMDSLSLEGDYDGYLHNLAIHTGVLTQLQLYHTKYMHLYALARGRAIGLYHRLITEDIAIVAMLLDSAVDTYLDMVSLAVGSDNSVTKNGSAGCTFESGTSVVSIAHSSALNSDDLTIFIDGTFTGSEAAGTIVDKGTDFKFLSNGNQLDFNGSTIAHTFANNSQIAVVVKPGYEPRFYVDDVFIGEGSSTVTPVPDTTSLFLGNNNELNSPTQYAIKHIYICNKALTDAEIRAMGEQARYIGAQ